MPSKLSEEQILAILESAYSGAVYDAMRELGLDDGILPNDIQPVDPNIPLVGKVWTCSGGIVEGISQDDSLLSWTGMLSAAPSGSVVVCQPNDSTIAHMGELSAETLKFRGVKGYIVDGGNRDTDFILKLGFPVFCRYLTPSDIVELWMVQTMGEPITIGNVDIKTGDYIVADRDGAVVIPASAASNVANRVDEVMNTENELRNMILGGMDPQEAYLKYRRF
ncbi:MAG: RraA family protein [Chloroflexi bacterium]|nr:RraA family protein [Chloroflexota bacterium]MYK61379.1 RraA family protein [Chloroflexota bacterium]